MTFSYEKLNSIYADKTCDYKTNDCLVAALKYYDIKVPKGFDDYNSKLKAFKNIKRYGGLPKGFKDHGFVEVGFKNAGRGDLVLRDEYYTGIYVGNRRAQFINGCFLITDSDRFFHKEDK